MARPPLPMPVIISEKTEGPVIISGSTEKFTDKTITFLLGVNKYRLFAFDFDGVLRLESIFIPEGEDRSADKGLFSDMIKTLDRERRDYGIVSFNTKTEVERWLKDVGMDKKFVFGKNLVTPELYNAPTVEKADAVLINKNVMLTTLIQGANKKPLDPENPVKPSNTVLFEDSKKNASTAAYLGDGFDFDRFTRLSDNQKPDESIDAVLLSPNRIVFFITISFFISCNLCRFASMRRIFAMLHWPTVLLICAF